MDNLCHSLVGMALSRAGLNKRTALATSTLVIANNLPDIDVGVFATSTLAMSFRRGWTHGVLAQATLPIALTGAMLLYDRYRKKASPDDRVNAGQILLLSYIGVLLHVFMDFCNSYGVRLLMPFSDRWFYGDALYIVDPWLYLTLGLGWWLREAESAAGAHRRDAGRDLCRGHARIQRDRAARSRRAASRVPGVRPRRVSW